MPETGVLLKDYVLPIVVLLELICTIIGGILVVASTIAGIKSTSRQRKNRTEKLDWQLKALGYTTMWTLLFAISSVFGVVIGLIVGVKTLLYSNFFVGVLFSVFFLVIKQARKFVSKELDSVKTILGG